MVWNPFEDFSISDLIPESISMIFEKIGDFIDGTILVFLNIYVLLIVLLFLALVALMFWVPIKIYPIYKQNKKMLDKFIKIRE